MASKRESTQLVPAIEVAAAVGGSVEWIMEKAGADAAEDWAGRPAVPTEIAARIVSASRASIASAQAKQSAYDSYLRQREADREAAGDKAVADAVPELRKRQYAEARESYTWIDLPPGMSLGPKERMAAYAIRREALEKFDRSHPIVPFDRFEG
jgi:hypothetical protein